MPPASGAPTQPRQRPASVTSSLPAGAVQASSWTGPSWSGVPGPAPLAPELTSAPQPGIVPLRPLSVAEILSGAFEVLRVNPRAMFLPTLAVMTVLAALNALVTYVLSRSTAGVVADGSLQDAQDLSLALPTVLGDMSSVLTLGVLEILSQAVLTGLLIVAVSRAVLGRVVTPGEAWRRTRARVPALIGEAAVVGAVNLLIMTAMGVLTVATLTVTVAASPSDSLGGLLVAAVLVLVCLAAGALGASFLWVRLALAPAALVLEGIGVLASLRRSWALTRDAFWRVLGTLLLGGLVTAAISSLLTVVVTIVAVIGELVVTMPAVLTQVIVTVLICLLGTLTVPFQPAVCALTYIDLRMRHEGLDVELRRVPAVSAQDDRAYL